MSAAEAQGQSKDVLGNLSVTEYDPILNKPTRITDALGHVTQLGYDVKGNLISVTNAVSFAGQTIPSVFVSATQLTAMVPGNLLAAPGTAAVLIINPAGNTTVSSQALTVNIIPAGPTITGFSPAAGPVGSPVIITGARFDPNPAVSRPHVRCPFSAHQPPIFWRAFDSLSGFSRQYRGYRVAMSVNLSRTASVCP